MKKLTIVTVLVSFFLSFSIYAEPDVSTPITGLVVFGDSLSDNGNLYHLQEGKTLNWPYYFGRCSNGLVWVEILTASLNLSPNKLDDRAIAGAQTHNGMKTSPGMLSQVQDYLSTAQSVDPNRLYVVWVGGNNYIYHPFWSSDRAQQHAIDRAVDDIAEAIQVLSAHGARYFLIPNLPDIGATPLAKRMKDKHPKLNFQANLTQLSEKHNQLLQRRLNLLQKQLGVSITQVDVFSMMQEAIHNPHQYGLTNPFEPCYQGSYLGGGKACATPDQHLFWDAVHPTFAGHKMLSEIALDALKTDGLVKILSTASN